jgi:hypothetical protein
MDNTANEGSPIMKSLIVELIDKIKLANKVSIPL